MRATDLAGPWAVADQPPADAAEAEAQALKAATPVDLLEGATDSANHPPPLSQSTAPVVYVSSKPAELVLFEGAPDFLPIPGTRLLYAENTTANVFKSLADQKIYVLLSGRWYRAASPQGPWQFVLADHLPPDFAEIPDDSPKENVKASVPGTPQATEALIANSVPQSTKVPLKTEMPKPQIDGPPRLQLIAGTPLYYVVNSGTPLIRVDEHSWYACQNGVWFAANSLDGPWIVATSVPPVIYTIPPSSPLHYLTYVQVFGTTPQELYEGYTPGYLGTEVEDGVVVYGTGYYYPPWVGAEWYGWPCTWGFGWGPCWNPWDDWCFDFGFGWGCGFGAFGWWRCHPLRPWWGKERNWHHEAGAIAWRRGNTASTARDVFRRPSAIGSTASTRATGRIAAASSYGRAYNSRTGALAAGQHASVQNVYSAVESRGPVASSWNRSVLESRNGQNFRSSASFGGAMRGFGRPSFSGQSSSGYFNGSAYSRGYGYSYGHSGYSHGGWGGGRSGGGGGGHGGSGGGYGGGGHGGGGR